MSRFSIHDLTPCLAASSSISWMSFGLPIAEPPMWTLPMMKGKAGRGGSGFSGAPTTVCIGERRERSEGQDEKRLVTKEGDTHG